MKFKISSALKDHIGKELITDNNVAIFELVKNSYDADAKNVKIIFKDMRSPQKRIYIIDNGKGMSEEELEKKWFFLGYSEKRDFEKLLKDKEKSKRFLAGAKGMGRFSCDRLGSKLKVYTRTKLEKDFNVVELDWAKFEEDQKKEFISIDVKTSRQNILKFDFGKFDNPGTIIEINDLRDDWTWKDLQKTKRYLQRLINPLQIPNEDSFDIELIAEDFIVDDTKQKHDYDRVNGLVKNIAYEKIKMKTTTMECNISEDGKEIFTKLEDKGIPIFTLKEKNNFLLLKGIKVKVSYLNPQAKRTFKRDMGVEAKNYGHIFLFKNGFRVLPYGEIEDDWLELNLRKTQGYSRNLGTRELLGRIEINDSENNFREATSRNHGLLNTPSFEQLQKFVLEVILKKLEKYVVGAIYWDSEIKTKDFEEIKKDSKKIIKQIAGDLENKDLWYNKDFLEIVEEKTIEKIPETIETIEDLMKKEKDKEIKLVYNQQIQSLKIGLKLEKEKQKEKLEEKEEEIKEIKSELEIKEKEGLFLSGALSVDQEATQRLIHIINNSTDPIQKALSEINKHIQKNSPIEKIIPFVDDISLEHDQIKYLSEILSMANFNTKVETIKRDIVQYIFEYLTNMKYSSLKFDFKNEDIKFVCRFKPLEILIILNNFISNSLKQDATRIRLDFEKNKDFLVLLISDNSDNGGIKDKDAPHIFNRAYSTTKGAGQGLYDVKRILKNLNGNIKFIGNNIENQLNGACFEIKIRK
ncbi:ATP-binding protein [Candidatus Pacearchaeota archaeon]|nr:ATP-binding protein [Candidatus Pacearchaeota archaeon]MBI2056715.1 ATP-binding protein [Candidatus Pacearchaeota archaeon]